jgi:8-oxo-dGTP diphosphatase
MPTFAIATALVQYKKQLLIAKRASSKRYAPNQWEFISGFLDTSEPIEELILRELKEETGLQGRVTKNGKPFSIVDIEAEWIIIPFLIEIKSKKVTLNSKDHSEFKWIGRKDFGKYADLKPFAPMKKLL